MPGLVPLSAPLWRTGPHVMNISGCKANDFAPVLVTRTTDRGFPADVVAASPIGTSSVSRPVALSHPHTGDSLLP